MKAVDSNPISVHKHCSVCSTRLSRSCNFLSWSDDSTHIKAKTFWSYSFFNIVVIAANQSFRNIYTFFATSTKATSLHFLNYYLWLISIGFSFSITSTRNLIPSNFSQHSNRKIRGFPMILSFAICFFWDSSCEISSKRIPERIKKFNELPRSLFWISCKQRIDSQECFFQELEITKYRCH